MLSVKAQRSSKHQSKLKGSSSRPKLDRHGFDSRSSAFLPLRKPGKALSLMLILVF